VRVNGQPATLASVASGHRVIVVQGLTHPRVSARR
jgi:hypothetical protein